MMDDKTFTTKPNRSAPRRRRCPELAEHDRVAELEKQLEDATSKALYAAAETQNVRRRLEAEKQQAQPMPRPALPATCWRCAIISPARWTMCPRRRGPKEKIKSFVDGIEATLRDSTPVFARSSGGRIDSLASSSTRIVTRR